MTIYEAAPTGIDCGDSAFHNDYRESVQSSKQCYDLLKCRKFSYHVQEHGDECAHAEEQSGHGSITLARPLGQDKAFWTFAPDDRAQGSKDEER